jgi:hypothetical protein
MGEPFGGQEIAAVARLVFRSAEIENESQEASQLPSSASAVDPTAPPTIFHESANHPDGDE